MNKIPNFRRIQLLLLEKYIKPIVLLLLLGNMSFSQVADTSYLKTINSSRILIEEIISGKKVPGVAITVVKNNKTIWSEGFGLSNQELQLNVKPGTTLFRIASISKALTATGLAVLYQHKKIVLDLPIQHYLPDFPQKCPITLRQLAGHTAGIRHYRKNEFYNVKPLTIKEGIKVFESDSLLFSPGTAFQYSSYGYNLISYIMQRHTDTPFFDLIRQNVLEPLQMRNTFPELTESRHPETACFYSTKKDGIMEIAPEVDNGYKLGSGGFLSTTEDLVKLGNAYLYGNILTKESIAELLSIQNQNVNYNYGLGWELHYDHKGELACFYHSGSGVGSYSILLVYPEKKVVIALLCNTNNPEIRRLPFKISKQFLEP